MAYFLIFVVKIFPHEFKLYLKFCLWKFKLFKIFSSKPTFFGFLMTQFIQYSLHLENKVFSTNNNFNRLFRVKKLGHKTYILKIISESLSQQNEKFGNDLNSKPFPTWELTPKNEFRNIGIPYEKRMHA